MLLEEILFIVNPISEEKRNVNSRALIQRYLDTDKFNPVIEYSKYAGHAYDLAKENAAKYNKIVAIGGDGTVNQVSKALVGAKVAMGIIPLGSGNGLSRALGIPVKPAKAMGHIMHAGIKTIDSGLINGYHFLNMAGVGFDAEVAHTFGLQGKRGLKTYVKETIRHLRSYKPPLLTFEGSNIHKEVSPFLLSIANSSQYGNNAHISPRARYDDGLLDVCIMKQFPLWKSPAIASRLFFKTLDKSRYMDIFQVEKCILRNQGTLKGHVDGEPVFFYEDIIIEVKSKSVMVIA